MAHADRVAFLRIGVEVKHRRSRRLHYCAGESTLISALGISVRLLNQDVILELIDTHSSEFTYSRTKMLFNDFVDVFKIPDITVITPIMGSREPNDPTITSAKLAAQIPNSVLVDSLEAAADWVKQNAREGDLVITLGCGDIYKASKMMVKKD